LKEIVKQLNIARSCYLDSKGKLDKRNTVAAEKIKNSSASGRDSLAKEVITRNILKN